MAAQLQERIHQMQASVPRVDLATHPAFSGLLAVRTGGAYAVDSVTLALALLAPPSAQGAWTAVVGVPEWGVEAAESLGVDLNRTVVVPEPGEHWVEVAAALIDVVSVVVLRPPHRVAARAANRLGARLRKHACALVALGSWPGAEAHLGVESSTWVGAERGHGRLQGRQLTVSVVRGSAPARKVDLILTETGLALTDRFAGEHPADVVLVG